MHCIFKRKGVKGKANTGHSYAGLMKSRNIAQDLSKCKGDTLCVSTLGIEKLLNVLFSWEIIQ